MNRTTDVIIKGMAFIFGLYVLIRAWSVPITVDECSTAFTHVPRNVLDTLFFLKDGNPNNHILNTLSIKALTSMFGWHPFIIRIPALLGAFMYAVSGFFLCRKISINPWVGVFTYALMLGQPFFLEFFSLARGYALGIGFMTTAIWQACIFLKEGKQKGLYAAIVFAGLAVYSNFTQIIFFIPFTGLLFWSILQSGTSFKMFWEKARGAILLLVAEMVLIGIPLRVLSKDSEIKNWNQLGTLFESAEKSIRIAIHKSAFIYNDTAHVLTILAVFFTLGLGYVLVKKLLNDQVKFTDDMRIFIACLLPTTILANTLQVELTHTPYLEPRLALLYWPLFALTLGATASWLNERWEKWARVFMVILVIGAFFNTAKCVNLKEAYEWWHDRGTYEVLDYIREVQQKEAHPEPFTFDTHWVMQNSFLYHVQRDPRGFNKIITLAEWHGVRPPTEEYEFYYALSVEDAQPVLNTYEEVFKPSGGTMVLFRKKKK